MKVFISWSGEVSKLVAVALRDWLQSVLQAVRPFMSEEDIPKGARWLEELSRELDDAAFGIVCVTPENKDAPWLLFESGAISKRVSIGKVIPLVIGMKKTDVIGPLSHFQSTLPEKDDVTRLLATLNENLGDAKLSEGRLQETFEVWWPRLEQKLREAEEQLKAAGAVAPERQPGEMLAEVLELTRFISRHLAEREKLDALSREWVRKWWERGGPAESPWLFTSENTPNLRLSDLLYPRESLATKAATPARQEPPQTKTPGDDSTQ